MVTSDLITGVITEEGFMEQLDITKKWSLCVNMLNPL